MEPELFAKPKTIAQLDHNVRTLFSMNADINDLNTKTLERLVAAASSLEERVAALERKTQVS